ncbi:MAG: iron permease FTR1 [Rhizobiales bacterium]|nr:iron permease FTR1 [Hyphomicrobiales bacterium]
MSGTFIQAAVILLREGLEAMLVIAALAAYLKKAGAEQRLVALYSGAVIAILASLVAAYLFLTLNEGQHNDLFEAFVILAAAALMLYVSGWLLVRQDPRAWQAYLKEQAEGALAKGTGLAVAALAFLAVFREGAETVLFVYALASASGGWSADLFAGLAAAAVGLVILFFVINAVASRLPLRAVFIITSALLFVMAVKMIGDAILEFQEQLIVPMNPVPSLGWMLEYGLNPTREALLAQGAVIVLAIVSFLWWRRSATSATAAATKAS